VRVVRAVHHPEVPVSHDVTLPGGAPAPLADPPPRLLDPRAPFLLPLALLLLTRAYFWRLLPSASEDAYITFRYARNLARGLGLVLPFAHCTTVGSKTRANRTVARN
jgi:hypothetical protein